MVQPLPELTPPPDVFAKMMLDVIRKHKMESRSIVQSFDFRTLHAMKQLARFAIERQGVLTALDQLKSATPVPTVANRPAQ